MSTDLTITAIRNGLHVDWQHKLGHGTYGKVYLASGEPIIDRKSGELALKVQDMREHIKNNHLGDYIRVLREIRLVTNLAHSNIVRFHGAILSANLNSLGLVFKRWDCSLTKLLTESSQTLELEQVQVLMLQLAQALQYLEDSHVVHCDIKPANILLMKDCRLGLTDFGMARWSLREHASDLVYTRWYRAPEIIFERPFGPPADIWAAGCVFAELLLAMLPVEERTHPPALFSVPEEPDEQIMTMLQVLGPLTDLEINQLAMGSFNIVSWFKKAIKNCEKGGHSVPMKLTDLFSYAPPLAIDLLQKMLMFDTTKRIAATEILQHPFFDTLPKQWRRERKSPATVSTLDIDVLEINATPEQLKTKLQSLADDTLPANKAVVELALVEPGKANQEPPNSHHVLANYQDDLPTNYQDDLL